MHIIVQEGRAVLSLVAPIQIYDDSLRSQTVAEFSEDVKAYYRDFELVRIEARGGTVGDPAGGRGQHLLGGEGASLPTQSQRVGWGPRGAGPYHRSSGSVEYGPRRTWGSAAMRTSGAR